jgi:cell division septal protein FtsQ
MLFRKHRLLTFLAILLIAGLSYLLGWSNVLTVKEISYTGAPTKSSEVTVKNLTNLEVGERLARVETREISGRLQTLPLIESADL